jgi:molybdate transport system regulatory protein
MSLSIRNQIPGTVASVAPGEVMAIVKLHLDGGQMLTAAITLEAVRDLGLDAGSTVQALIKSTEVSLATGPVTGLSIRNQLPGTVTGVATGGAMASVKVSIAGAELTSAITREAVAELRLASGSGVVALIKATEISLSVA